jgi:uncharacterized membrane protein
MSNDLHLLVYTFDSVGQAETARAALEKLDSQLGGSSGYFAVVLRAADGAISLREPRDLREELSTIAASVAGGVTWFVYTFVGLVGTPPAFVAERLTDDAVHSMVRDSGFPDAALYEIGEELGRGSAAVVALVPSVERSPLVSQLERLGGKLWDHQLPAAVAEAIDSWRAPVA